MHSNFNLFIVNHAFINPVRSMPTLPLPDEEAADKWIDLEDHFETGYGRSLVSRTGKLEHRLDARVRRTWSARRTCGGDELRQVEEVHRVILSMLFTDIYASYRLRYM